MKKVNFVIHDHKAIKAGYHQDIRFEDPQNKKKVKSDLENAGAMVMDSNAAASELAGKIIKNLKWRINPLNFDKSAPVKVRGK